MKRLHRALGLTLALLLVPALAGALVPEGDLPQGMTHVTSVEGIDEYVLENGLKVIFFQDLSKQTTTVNITYLVGSLHEGYGETGMAHLLEHLVFKGTPKHPDIPQELTSHGARPNGTTWYDRTNYFETFAATEENLEWALDLEADRMVNSYIAKEDLDSEMTVVRNEFEMGENYPEYVLEERVYSTAYLWHNYGNTTIGSRADIERVPIERLQAFYKTWYRPENAVLVVAGNFDEAKTAGLVVEKFGPLENPETPLPTVYTMEPAQDGERSVVLRRVGDKQVGSVAYHIPAGPHPQNAALRVFAFLLGDEPSGRLYKSLVESGKATSVRASADRFKDPGLLYCSAEFPLDGSMDDVIATMIDEIENFSDQPPTEEDVNRARTKLLRDWELTMRDSPRAAIRLSEWAAMGDWRMVFLYRDWLQEVEVGDVLEVAGSYFNETNRTVGRYVPTEAAERIAIPEAPPTAEMLAGYTGAVAMAAGEEFVPTPENIEANLVRETLPSGMKLVMLPKKTRGEAVTAHLSLHLGTEESLKGQAIPSQLAGSMLMRGTESRSRQDIEDEIDRLQIRLTLSGAADRATGSLEATRPSLEAAMRLMADCVKNPTFPESEYEQIVRKAIQDEEEARSDPFSRAARTLYRHMSPWPEDDVRYTHTPEEMIAELESADVDDLEEFHSEFYGASAAELAVVGDFDPAEVSALVNELFGDWKSEEAHERLASPYQDRPAIFEAEETPDKESAVMMASARMKVRDDSADYPALVMGNFMTGGGFLNSRLATRIRRTDGLSYGVRSRFFASSFDESAWFSGWAIYAPQNDEPLVEAFREEIDKVLADGFADDELAEAKSGWLQSQEVSRGQDRELARKLTDLEYRGRTMEWQAAFEENVRGLTPEQIREAMTRHLDPAKISIVRAGDFEGATMEGEAADSPQTH